MDRGLFQAYVSTLSLAILPIVMGSFGSLKTSKRSARLLRKKSKSKDSEDDESEDVEDAEDEVERISFNDAWMFPILGSCMLGGLYLVFKYVDRIWINWFIGWYFTVAGVLTIFETSSVVLKFLTPRMVSSRLPVYKINITEDSKKFFSTTLPFISLASIPIALAVPYVYATQDKPWWANNILGFSFAHTAIQLMKLDSFITGATLLGGLFFYDIFWVFGTDVMVSVAKGLEAPVKLVFPKDPGMSGAQGYSMLGLGDIVIPGIFIALALRYDFSRASSSKPLRPSDPFAKPYFLSTLVAYVLGLITTIVVMHTFKAAQPALLYLSPACVGAVVLVALVQGELNQLVRWGDADDDEKEKERTKKRKEAKKQVGETEEDRVVSVGKALTEGPAFDNPLTDSYLQLLYAPPPSASPVAPSMSDLLAATPPPLSRFLLLSAPLIASVRVGLEILLWRNPKRGWSWSVVLGWWAVCLGGSGLVKYFLPPVFLLTYLYPNLPTLHDILLFRFSSDPTRYHTTLKTTQPSSKAATSQTILHATSDYSAVHSLLSNAWPPLWLTHLGREWENGNWRRILRGLVGVWLVWVLGGFLLGSKVTLGATGTIILLLPSPYIHPIQTAFESSYHLNRIRLFLSLIILGPSSSTPPSTAHGLFSWAWSISAQLAALNTDTQRGRRSSMKALFMGLKKGENTVDASPGAPSLVVDGKSKADEKLIWEEEPIAFRFEVIENQRWWLALDWTATLAPGDRPVWCDIYLNPTPPPPSFTLPPPHTITVPSTTRPNYDEVRTANWRWTEDDWSVLRNIEGQFKSSFVPSTLSDSPTHSNHPLPSTGGLGANGPIGGSIGGAAAAALGVGSPTRMSLGEQALSRGLERLKAVTSTATTSSHHSSPSIPSTSSILPGGNIAPLPASQANPSVESGTQPKRSGSISISSALSPSGSVDGDRKTLFSMSLQGGAEVLAGEGGVGAVLGLVECEDLEARTDEGGWSYGGNKWEGMSAKGGLGKFTRRRRWTRKAICTEHVELVPSSYRLPEAPSRPTISSVNTSVPEASPISLSNDVFVAGGSVGGGAKTSAVAPVGSTGVKGEVTNAGGSAGDALRLRLKRLV